MEATHGSIEVGVPVDSIELLDLPLSLSRGEYLESRAGGQMTVEKY
jgi:hypothetical protein